MYHCRQAYEGLMEGQICVGVCDGSLRPELEAACPSDFRALLSQCWAQDPNARCAYCRVTTDNRLCTTWQSSGSPS